MARRRDLRRKYKARRNDIRDYRRQDERPVERTQDMTNHSGSCVRDEQEEILRIQEEAGAKLTK